MYTAPTCASRKAARNPRFAAQFLEGLISLQFSSSPFARPNPGLELAGTELLEATAAEMPIRISSRPIRPE